MPIEKVCKVCGVTFYVPSVRDKTAFFCSKSCATTYYWKGKTTEVLKNCLTCGKQFETKEAWIRKGAGKYCSYQCANEAKRRRDLPVEEFIECYASGMSLMQISKKFNVGHMIVKRRLVEEGVQLRGVEEGIVLAYQKLRGPDNCQWKGGRYLQKTRKRDKGYWRIYKPDSPSSDKHGYVLEHRDVWEKSTGKQIPKGWVVHHRNGIEDDNRPENLEAMSGNKHSKLHNDLRAKALFDAKNRIKELEEENNKLLTLLNNVKQI